VDVRLAIIWERLLEGRVDAKW